jgi:hypothetical protein
MGQNGDERALVHSAPREAAFRLHVYEHAPRRDNGERKRWADSYRNSYRGGSDKPPLANRIANYSGGNLSDLGGALVAPADICRIELRPKAWVRIWLSPSGARLGCPIEHLLHRDSFRAVVWQQARAIICMPSEREWSRFVSERLGAFGIVLMPRKRLPRYHEADSDRDDLELV